MIMSYIVRNMTSRTVVLSDLRAEIGPYKILDLEKVALRDRIINSFDLNQALQTEKIMLVKHSVIYGPKRSDKNASFDKDQLVSAIREVMTEINAKKEEKPTEIQANKEPHEDIDKIVKDNLSHFMNELRDQINSISISTESTNNDRSSEPTISPEQLAKLQEKHIKNVSQKIEASVKEGRKIKLKNDKISDLANELGD